MDIKVKNNEIQIMERGEVIGRLCFEEKEKTIIVTHTYVDEAYGGKHLAQKLMEVFISYLEPLGKQCIPSCSYAKHWFQKHPEKQYLINSNYVEQ